MSPPMQSAAPWLQLQRFLWQLLAQARDQDKFPTSIPLCISSRKSCEKALERFPLDQWVKCTPSDVQNSVVKWRETGQWADNWSIWFICPPGEGVDEFVRRKQEQEVTDMQAQLKIING